MISYLVQRLIYGIGVLLGVSVIVFFLIHFTADPCSVILPPDASATDRQICRRQLGLDQPLPVQYAIFLSRAVQGDFGFSYRHQGYAMDLVLERLPATLKLMAVAVTFAVLVAVPLGILAAWKRDTPIDALARTFVLFGQAVPDFWLGIVLILIFAVGLRWFPVSGARGWESLILPGITIGAFPLTTIARLLRSSLLEVMGQDYIRTAWGKGLPPRAVLWKHALKNAAIPTVTVIGLEVGFLFGGAVVAENVFAYPGMGRLAVNAIANRDIPVVQAFVAVTATVIVGVNLLVDLIYTWLDPRIRL